MIYIPRYVNGLLFYTAYWLVSSRYMFSKYLFIPGIVGGILWISYTTLKVQKNTFTERMQKQMSYLLNKKLEVLVTESQELNSILEDERMTKLPIVLRYIHLALKLKKPADDETLRMFEAYNLQYNNKLDARALEKNEFNGTVQMYINLFYETLLEIKDLEEDNGNDNSGGSLADDWIERLQTILSRYGPAIDRANISDKHFRQIPHKAYPLEIISYERIEKAYGYLMQNISCYVNSETCKDKYAKFLIDIQQFKLNDI